MAGAYNLIYREWFRDQNLIDSPVVDTDDGPDSPTDYPPSSASKRHDYFATAVASRKRILLTYPRPAIP